MRPAPHVIMAFLALALVLIPAASAIKCYTGNQQPPLLGQTTYLTQTNCTAQSSVYDRCSAYTNDGIRMYTCDFDSGSATGTGCNNPDVRFLWSFLSIT